MANSVGEAGGRAARDHMAFPRFSPAGSAAARSHWWVSLLSQEIYATGRRRDFAPLRLNYDLYSSNMASTLSGIYRPWGGGGGRLKIIISILNYSRAEHIISFNS